jgi:hypothetical protein
MKPNGEMKQQQKPSGNNNNNHSIFIFPKAGFDFCFSRSVNIVTNFRALTLCREIESVVIMQMILKVSLY